MASMSAFTTNTTNKENSECTDKSVIDKLMDFAIGDIKDTSILNNKTFESLNNSEEVNFNKIVDECEILEKVSSGVQVKNDIMCPLFEVACDLMELDSSDLAVDLLHSIRSMINSVTCRHIPGPIVELRQLSESLLVCLVTKPAIILSVFASFLKLDSEIEDYILKEAQKGNSYAKFITVMMKCTELHVKKVPEETDFILDDDIFLYILTINYDIEIEEQFKYKMLAAIYLVLDTVSMGKDIFGILWEGVKKCSNYATVSFCIGASYFKTAKAGPELTREIRDAFCEAASYFLTSAQLSHSDSIIFRDACASIFSICMILGKDKYSIKFAKGFIDGNNRIPRVVRRLFKDRTFAPYHEMIINKFPELNFYSNFVPST